MQKIIFVKSDKTVLSHFKLKHTIYLYSHHVLKIYSFDLINNQPYHISNKNTLSIYIHIQKSYILSLSKQISPIIFHNLNQSPQLLFNKSPRLACDHVTSFTESCYSDFYFLPPRTYPSLAVPDYSDPMN